MLRLYTRIGGVALVTLGAAGVIGVLGLGTGEILLYLFTGVIFSYMGFGGWADEPMRTVVGGIGILYLLVGLSAIVVLLALDMPIAKEDVMRPALGTLNLFGATFLRSEDDPVMKP